MNDSPKIKEHDDMSQRKNAKAIPFQWKTILCDATGYQDEYQKAIQLIQLAEQTSQRKVG